MVLSTSRAEIQQLLSACEGDLVDAENVRAGVSASTLVRVWSKSVPERALGHGFWQSRQPAAALIDMAVSAYWRGRHRGSLLTETCLEEKRREISDVRKEQRFPGFII